MAILRPSSDLITGGWSSTDASLSAAIDETTASDSDYISSSTAGQIARVSLGTYTTSAGTHTLKYRAASPEADRGLIVRVLELGQPPAIVTSKQPWRRQPQVPVGIDWGNPLTNGLISAFIVTDGVLRRVQNTVYSVGTQAVNKYGPARLFNGTNQYIIAGMPHVFQGNNLTCIAVITSGAAAATRTIITSNSSGGMNGAQVRLNGTGISLVKGGVVEMINASGSVAANEDCIIGITYDGSKVKAYKNGILKAANSISQSFTHDSQYIGQRGNGSEFFDGKINAILTFSTSYDFVALELTNNPWQILQPQKRISYFDAPKIIASHTKTNTELGTTPAQQTLTLTAGEASGITNGAELALEVEST